MTVHPRTTIAAIASAAICLAGCSAPAPTTAAAPAPTVTVTATPAAAQSDCEQFIADADTLVELERKVIELAGDGMGAVSEFDADQLDEITAEINDLQPQVEDAVDAYTTSRATCEGSI